MAVRLKVKILGSQDAEPGDIALDSMFEFSIGEEAREKLSEGAEVGDDNDVQLPPAAAHGVSTPKLLQLSASSFVSAFFR